MYRAQAKERQGTRTDLNIPQNSAGSAPKETRDAIAAISPRMHSGWRWDEGITA